MQNCYTDGRIPRELMHAQSERLTTKHIQTLTFLQDIAKENKELKDRVEDLQNQLSQCAELHNLAESNKERMKNLREEYLAHADMINQTLIEKHKAELLKKLDDKLKAEEEWEQERKKLSNEIEKLNKEVHQLKVHQTDLQKEKSISQQLRERLIALEKDFLEAKDERGNLEQIRDNQLEELTRLKHVSERNLDLIEEVKEVKQKNKELLFRIDRLEKDLEEPNRQEQEEVMSALRNRLTKLHKEKSHFEAKEMVYEKQSAELKQENGMLRRALNDSERMRGEMHEHIQALLVEISTVRQQGMHSGRERQQFKDFVQLKRDMMMLKEENDELKTRLKLATGSGKVGTLPSLKPHGAPGSKDKKGKAAKQDGLVPKALNGRE